MKATYTRYSMCICGFPMLSDSVPIGTVYDVDEKILAPFSWRCGGCHKIQTVQGVWVHARGSSSAGFLPLEIFELEKGTE